MSITKRATISGKIVVSNTMLECPKCGHRDVGEGEDDVECPKCHAKMVVAFCSAGGEDEKE